MEKLAVVIIFCITIPLGGCSTFPAIAGKEYSWETERNWQILNAANAFNVVRNQDCLNTKIPTFSGLVVSPDTNKGEIAGYFALNALIHYSISKLLYHNAPDRYWRAWNFSTQGMVTWDLAAPATNC